MNFLGIVIVAVIFSVCMTGIAAYLSWLESKQPRRTYIDHSNIHKMYIRGQSIFVECKDGTKWYTRREITVDPVEAGRIYAVFIEYID